MPRCFRPEDFGKVVKRELHHFSDASTKGYGQYSYLRLTDRVTPLKPVTIPRLELQAAVMSVKVSQQLHRELDLSRRFHIFVPNRLQVLQDATSIEHWKYVDTKLNPADHA